LFYRLLQFGMLLTGRKLVQGTLRLAALLCERARTGVRR
jgi:hypothetical protein